MASWTSACGHVTVKIRIELILCLFPAVDQGDSYPNELLFSLFVDKLQSEYDRQVTLSTSQCMQVVHLIQSRDPDAFVYKPGMEDGNADNYCGDDSQTTVKRTESSNSLSTTISSVTNQSGMSSHISQNQTDTPKQCSSSSKTHIPGTNKQAERIPHWLCFVKSISGTHIMLCFLPATYTDLRMLRKKAQPSEAKQAEGDVEGIKSTESAEKLKAGFRIPSEDTVKTKAKDRVPSGESEKSRKFSGEKEKLRQLSGDKGKSRQLSGEKEKLRQLSGEKELSRRNSGEKEKSKTDNVKAPDEEKTTIKDRSDRRPSGDKERSKSEVTKPPEEKSTAKDRSDRKASATPPEEEAATKDRRPSGETEKPKAEQPQTDGKADQNMETDNETDTPTSDVTVEDEKLEVDESESNTDQADDIRDSPETAEPPLEPEEEALDLPVYIFNCPLSMVTEQLINKWTYHRPDDITEDLTFK